MKTVKKKWSCWVVALLFTFIFTSPLEAATLTVGSNSGIPGDKNILIPINLSSAPGEKASGFNFDLTFDTSRLSFNEVTLGPKAEEADKSLSSSRPSVDVVRVIVIGFNQNIIENGEVLIFNFDILNSAPSGSAELNITKPSISDPQGNLLTVNTENGEIIVEGNPTDSTTTTSLSQLWPLLYNKMWGNNKDQSIFILRAFRDAILLNTKTGKEYVSLLYDNSIEIAVLLLQDPSYTRQANEVTHTLLQSIESLLYNDEIIMSQKTINDVEFLLNQLEPQASPKLEMVIKKVREDMREGIIFKQLGITIAK